MDRQSFYEEVSGFLATAWADGRKPGPAPVPEPGSNLFDLGLADSFTMIELIAFVEDKAAREIDILDVDPESLFTMQGIYDIAFGPGS